MGTKQRPVVEREAVVRLWLQRQGLSTPRGTLGLTKRTVSKHLNDTGALQLDTVNVVDRAHYLTLWSRFGRYDKGRLDKWIHGDRLGYEYWGHEASILPIEHLPLGRRRMARFPPENWRNAPWWTAYNSTPGSKRRVLRRLRDEGPLESADFERRPRERGSTKDVGWASALPKEDKRSLNVLWHAGRTAVHARRHFRRVYDLAERVYPEGPTASATEYEDSWLLTGLSGNGIAPERHLEGYFTAPKLKAPERRRVLARNVKRGRVVEVEVRDLPGTWYALPEHLDQLASLPEPDGTTLLCPFDSLLWQRKRAEELLGFSYRIEIYVPENKRTFGYYAVPILHAGRLVGRVDPKFDRERGVLEIKKLQLEAGVRLERELRLGLSGAIEDLAEFLGAAGTQLPRGWKRKLA